MYWNNGQIKGKKAAIFYEDNTSVILYVRNQKSI